MDIEPVDPSEPRVHLPNLILRRNYGKPGIAIALTLMRSAPSTLPLTLEVGMKALRRA